MNIQLVIGQRYGRLVVLSEGERRPAPGRAALRMINVRCVCGVEKLVRLSSLRQNQTKSCGCLQKSLQSQRSKAIFTTHGMSKTPIFARWLGMLARCNNKSHAEYKNYGARGIVVCDEWLKFENFYADMGDPPTGMSLDRIDVDGPYSKENCQWATASYQARNTRRAVRVRLNGAVMFAGDAAAKLGVSIRSVYGWLRAKHSPSAIKYQLEAV